MLRRPFSFRYRVRRADGAYGWIQDEGMPVIDEDGRLAGYLGTCHDVSEQREAELDAREKEMRVRLMADNVPALIAYFDVSDTCLFANKAYARMWGLDERSIIGKKVREVIGEAGYAEISPYIQRTLEREH